MDKWIIEGEIFMHPFTCIISGPTMCGKTFLLKEILKNKNVLIKPVPQRIILCYKAWQPTYEDFKNNIPHIEFNEGIIDMDSLNQSVNNLVIFDDLMSECIKSESVLNLFTVGSHHKNTGVFFITQNIFSKGKYARDISLNANYLIIFFNPRDQMQFNILARQMYPSNSKFLTESFSDATSKPHGYLFLDLKQSTPVKNRIQTGILPNQLRIVYTAK